MQPLKLEIERLEERIAPQMLGGGILVSADHEGTATQATQATHATHATQADHSDAGDAVDVANLVK